MAKQSKPKSSVPPGNGPQQSPIYLGRGTRIVPYHKDFLIKFGFASNYVDVVHEGNAIKIYGGAGTLDVVGRPADNVDIGHSYRLWQIHVHHHNEHVIPAMVLSTGKKFPASEAKQYVEIHMVFRDTAESVKAHEGKEDPLNPANRYVAIGLIGRSIPCLPEEYLAEAEPPYGTHTPPVLGAVTINRFVSRFVDSIPASGQSKASALPLNPAWLFGEESACLVSRENFYFYTGTLTTYPFTPNVHWLLHKQIIGIDQKFIEMIDEAVPPNARASRPVETTIYG